MQVAQNVPTLCLKNFISIFFFFSQISAFFVRGWIKRSEKTYSTAGANLGFSEGGRGGGGEWFQENFKKFVDFF